MTIGMAALMAVRRHAWPGIVEMSAAMYAPFIILFVPYWAGLITSGGLFLIGHLLMLPAMLLAMLHRGAEDTATRTTADADPRPLFPRRWLGRRRAPLGPGYFTGATTQAPAQHSVHPPPLSRSP
jgi:hypothetical protein